MKIFKRFVLALNVLGVHLKIIDAKSYRKSSIFMACIIYQSVWYCEKVPLSSDIDRSTIEGLKLLL